MDLSSTYLRFALAGGIALGGAGGALFVSRMPPAPPSVDLRPVRQELSRLTAQPSLAAPPIELQDPPRSAATPVPALRPKPLRKPRAVSPRATHTPAASQARPAAPQPATNLGEAAPKVPETVALLGVTTQAETEKAWLVDTATQERQVVGEGETAFGCTVETIEPESVTLANGGEDVVLHLGDRPIPPLSPEPSPPSPPAAPRRSGTSTSTPPAGGSRRAWRNWARQNGVQPGRSAGGRGNGAGRRPNRGGGQQRSLQRNTFAGAGRSQQFNGQGQRFQNGFGSANPFSRGFRISTSNPQTARRSGARLIGGVEPLPAMPSFRNPQTLRRQGIADRSLQSGFNTQRR